MWRSQPFIKAGRKRGVPDNILDNAIQTAGQLKNSVPPVFSLNHLANYAQVPHKELREIVERHNDPYRIFRMRKRPLPENAVRYRIIAIPSQRLKRVQRWIDREILERIDPDEASMAFNRDNSIFDAAALHCNAKWLIKVDIENFFESITEQQVYRALRGVGYQPLVSFELARLCTRLGVTSRNGSRWHSRSSRWMSIPSYSNTRLGYLPQGAPTSPRLSNLVARPLDERVRAIAGASDLRYTRYADDLVLSSEDKNFGRSAAVKVVGELYDAIRESGFSPNMAKTDIVPPRARKIVLGLGVETERPKLTRKFKAKIRQHIHFLCHPEFGPARHAAACGGGSIYGLKNHIQGLLAFAKGIEPSFAEKYTEKFNQIHWP